uniref:Actinin-like protein n=1 Tax=Psilocybe cubensis TaxID=181762 RepID=A0A8H7XS96_PSICU
MITPEAEARSRDMQERTFCKWLNTKLEAHGYPTMSSLVKDLSDGVRLIQLMEIMGDTSLGRYNKNPRMRVQKAENVNKALEFIRQRNVKLTNIGPEDIIDGNLKLILGMIWTLILRFTIADISEEGLSAKEGLLLWCQRKTEPYNEVNVQDFSHSWADGLALCALIHCHRPDLLDYPSLDKQLLEVEDLCDSAHPDERSVMTYIASFFHAFSTMDQAETVSRRVEKFAELMQSVWLIRNDYERRVRLLLSSLSDIQAQWALTPTSSCTSYPAAKALSASFTQYKSTTKRTWVAERQDLATLFGNVQTKLKTYGLREYVPPAGLTLADVDEAWEKLGRVEGERWRGVNAKIREIKEDLRKRFASLAHAFERSLQDVSSSLASLSGPLESQQAQVQHIQTHRLPQLSASLKELAEAEAACEAANVEENDYTVFTCQDLEFELELVVHGVAKKIGFIDNQIVSRNMTNLTPAQLEEFESTFRYFDKDETNTLNLAEMIAALASLGIVYSEEDMDLIYEQLVSEYGNVTFEAFINLLVEITEDQTSPDQLREAFRGIAKDKPFVTELDLRLAHLPAASIEYLREAMPKAPGPESNNNGSSSGGAGGEAEYDYDRFIDEVFGSTT